MDIIVIQTLSYRKEQTLDYYNLIDVLKTQVNSIEISYPYISDDIYGLYYGSIIIREKLKKKV